MVAFRKLIIAVYLALSLEELLCTLSKGNDLFQICGNLVPGYVLLDTVIQSFSGITHFIHCIENCQQNATCRSINWFRDSGLCQLNIDTHLSYPEGFVLNVTGNYMIYGCNPKATCSNKMCAEQTSVCLMEADGINFRCKGMAGWIPKKQPYEYLQIDLTTAHIISQVATQGRGYSHDGIQQWVTKYELEFTVNNLEWGTYNYGNRVMGFPGNFDKHSVVSHKLPAPIKARGIRFVVLEWFMDVLLIQYKRSCVLCPFYTSS